MPLSLALSVALLLSVPIGAQADHDPTDAYIDLHGTLYIDDDDIPYLYFETNGVPGMQRDANDGNLHGHYGHPNPDLWLV